MRVRFMRISRKIKRKIRVFWNEFRYIIPVFVMFFLLGFFICHKFVKENPPLCDKIPSHGPNCCQQAALRPSQVLSVSPDQDGVKKISSNSDSLMDFHKSLFRVIKYEGGYVNDPDDPGGETKYGISKKSYPHLNIRNLTFDQVFSIYHEDYWKKVRLNEVESDEIKSKLLDIVVQFGIEGGTRLWKTALKDVYDDEGDKKINSPDFDLDQIIEFTNKANPLNVVLALRMAMVRQYLTLVKRNPNLKKFLNGWLNRAHDDDGKKLSYQLDKL